MDARIESAHDAEIAAALPVSHIQFKQPSVIARIL